MNKYADCAHLEAVPHRVLHIQARSSSDNETGSRRSRFSADVNAMNDTAAMVFALCDGRRNIREIISLISDAYPELGGRIEADVLTALALQSCCGMIDITPRPLRIYYDVSQSGLGNRLRGLVSCLTLADILGIRLSMRWAPDDACDTWFHELFEVPPGIDYLGETTPTPHADASILYVTERLPPSVFYDKYRIYMPGIDYGSFRSNVVKHTRALLPVRDLTDKIAAFKGRIALDRSFVGLHIRRTDHPNASAMTDQLVNAVIEYEKLKAGTTRFFLATDNRHTQARFLRHPSVVSYPVRWRDEPLPEWGGPVSRLRRRHCPATDALIDLYLLAECRKIYAPGTSFSYYAGLLGGIKVTSPNALF